MLLDLNKSLRSIDGTEIFEDGTPLNISKWFAAQLYGSDLPDALHIKHLADTLYIEGKLELDEGDLLKLKEFALRKEPKTGKHFYTVAIRSVLESAFEKAKDTK